MKTEAEIIDDMAEAIYKHDPLERSKCVENPTGGIGCVTYKKVAYEDVVNSGRVLSDLSTRRITLEFQAKAAYQASGMKELREENERLRKGLEEIQASDNVHEAWYHQIAKQALEAIGDNNDLDS